MKRTEDSLRDFWDKSEMNQYLNYRGPRSKREKERVCENFWRGYSWKSPQHGKGNSQSSPKGTKSPIQGKPRRNTPRHIISKLRKTKHKERISKTSREKQQVTYKGNPIHLTSDHSAETLQARKEWQDIFKYWKGKIYNQDYCTWQGSHSKLVKK